MMGGTKVDFLHHAPSLRGLLKEPPYLWQPLSPDGGNLEHWAGGMEWWREREGRRDGGWKGGKGSGGGRREGAWAIARKTPKQMTGGDYLLLSLCSTCSTMADWFMKRTGGLSILHSGQAEEKEEEGKTFEMRNKKNGEKQTGTKRGEQKEMRWKNGGYA